MALFGSSSGSAAPAAPSPKLEAATAEVRAHIVYILTETARHDYGRVQPPG